MGFFSFWVSIRVFLLETNWKYSGARGTFFLRPSFWISLNIFRSTCRTTLIFLPLDRAMLEQHFSYLGHAHICSRKFSRRTWKKVFVKKSTFFKLFSRIFWLFKSLKNKILRLSEQLLTNYVSHDPNFFNRWIERC